MEDKERIDLSDYKCEEDRARRIAKFAESPAKDPGGPGREVAIITRPIDELPTEEWGLVEIFGHRRHYGRLVEIERFGAKLLRVDVPTESPHVFQQHTYGGGAIFCITPMTEDAVRKRCAQERQIYDASAAARSTFDVEDEEDRF